MALERIREAFNDGFMEYGHKQTKRSETGKRIGEAFTAEGKLAYKEVSCRESDFQMAGSLGSTLDLKVKTMYPPSFRKLNKDKLKVVIDDMEFDVIKVDPDRVNNYLYFYLQKVGVVSE